MSLLDAQGICKSYGTHVVLDAVNVQVGVSERLGVVGVNGGGKSTLARILAGAEAPDAGKLALRRGARVLYLPQLPVLDPELNVLQTVLTGLSGWHTAHERYEQATQALEKGGSDLEAALLVQAEAAQELERQGGWDVQHWAEAILERLALTQLTALAGNLSGGEQRRLALARVLVAKPDLAILDEPTNHLDIQTVEWLEQHLAECRFACVLITHDRYLLDRVATRTLEIDGGQVYSYQGGYRRYREAKAERLAHAERAEANRQNFLRRELEWLRRSPSARSTKQKARVQRAHSVLDTKAAAKPRQIQLNAQLSRTGRTILECTNLRLETPDGRVLVRELDLILTRGDRLGIVGPNGAGKTTLLRALQGEIQPTEGRVIQGKNTDIAYLNQLRGGLEEEASVLDNVANGRSHVRVGDTDVHAMTYLERFLFDPKQARTPVRALSGGERTRVALAKLLAQPNNLLILDEPTNDLDVDTLAALEQMLCEQESTALVVTHDRWFLDRIATGVLLFEGEGRVVRYEGSFSDLPAKQRTLRPSKEPSPTETRAPDEHSPRAKPKAKKTGLSFKEQRELKELESEIAKLEERTKELDALLSDPAAYQTRAEEIPDWVSERSAAEARTLELMERWAELEEKRDNGG